MSVQTAMAIQENRRRHNEAIRNEKAQILDEYMERGSKKCFMAWRIDVLTSHGMFVGHWLDRATVDEMIPSPFHWFIRGRDASELNARRH